MPYAPYHTFWDITSWHAFMAQRNGRILYYRIQIAEAGRQSDSEAAVITVDQASREFVADELRRWTDYRVWVLAGTSVGDGPPSFPVVARTDEDGTWVPHPAAVLLLPPPLPLGVPFYMSYTLSFSPT
ncbi:hypothetical protein J437_LFUL006846 [Ladona fulva]|uniref:Fibronectin type-III domain-containing protein n=1 Tax=Ladona fulva TaxID=123851 RepID=A0A8K0PAY7_LADFU|nr:hypothetical protein J437_LFUL006846 [Ladona fulva]